MSDFEEAAIESMTLRTTVTETIVPKARTSAYNIVRRDIQNAGILDIRRAKNWLLTNPGVEVVIRVHGYKAFSEVVDTELFERRDFMRHYWDPTLGHLSRKVLSFTFVNDDPSKLRGMIDTLMGKPFAAFPDIRVRGIDVDGWETMALNTVEALNGYIEKPGVASLNKSGTMVIQVPSKRCLSKVPKPLTKEELDLVYAFEKPLKDDYEAYKPHQKRQRLICWDDGVNIQKWELMV